MPDAASGINYQIILEKVPSDRQPDVALFLSGCFSLPLPSTRGIAASGPIAVLSDISKSQAEAIVEELAPSLPDGAILRIAGVEDAAKVSRLQWPRPPRIYGRDLAEFASQPECYSLICPLCRGVIRVSRDANGDLSVAAGSASDASRVSSRRLSSQADDKDPLFSGIKPLVSDTSNYASLRSLQAGDTGFWLDHGNSLFSSPESSGLDRTAVLAGDSTNAKKSTGKISAGLAAFMKPGAFALIAGRTKDPQTVKMIAEILGINQDEARDRCLNLGLCVARDISLDEAQNLLARFRGLGAKARIVKPM